MAKPAQPLETDKYYHIYNRGNNSQDIFFGEINYKHFIRLMYRHLTNDMNVYCYCLMKNHFHMLVRIRETSANPSKKLSNLFNAYTKAINKRYDRTGSLFEKPFRRIEIKDESYLRNLVIYIHTNPEHHRVSSDFRNYPFSSYSNYFRSENPIYREIIDLFEDLDNFVAVHLIKKERLELQDEYTLE